MTLETKRLLLREMDPADYDALLLVFGDPETMWHYPYTFDGQHVRDWIERNMGRYQKHGFGLWAVCLKDTGEVIGDCGLTLQNIHGETLPEIGYHIRRDCQRKGYAKEAARAVRDWAFRNTDYPALYSYCKYTNTPSIRTAESIGMRFDCEYPDEVNGTTHVSVIAREDWLRETMKGLVLYIHGKDGSAAECDHYRALFADHEVTGLDYQTFTPWETGAEIRAAVEKLKAEHESVILVANSIGAYFSMNAGIGAMIQRAYFISPIVDMEKLIADMMRWANVTEAELRSRGMIHTAFGEDLSWDYLCYVRSHPIEWAVPTRILYGSRDSLTSFETIRDFAKRHNAVLTVMEGGEHWFHTQEQMRFLDEWILGERDR